jgi:hypothetical protein
VQLATSQALATYWANEFDWRKAEARLNALPQFITRIDGIDVHFIHVRSKHDPALPVIMTHGWPGSVIELLAVVGPLTDPTAHGGAADDAFDLVLPSARRRLPPQRRKSGRFTSLPKRNGPASVVPPLRAVIGDLRRLRYQQASLWVVQDNAPARRFFEPSVGGRRGTRTAPERGAEFQLVRYARTLANSDGAPTAGGRVARPTPWERP